MQVWKLHNLPVDLLLNIKPVYTSEKNTGHMHHNWYCTCLYRHPCKFGSERLGEGAIDTCSLNFNQLIHLVIFSILSMYLYANFVQLKCTCSKNIYQSVIWKTKATFNNQRMTKILYPLMHFSRKFGTN